jgi:cation:H+ antiporter
MFQSVDIFSIPLLNLGLLLGAFALLLGVAEMFTNSVGWFGHHLGVSESATGSVLAAVGTALPETMIPVIAIVSVLLGRGDQAAADAIGVGAILGAPFMLATIAMTPVGASVLYFGSRRDAGPIFEADVTTLRRDLSFFVVGYTFTVVAAFVPSRGLRLGMALGLVVLYLVYVRQTLAAGQLIKGEELDRLYLKGLLTQGKRPFPAFGPCIFRRGATAVDGRHADRFRAPRDRRWSPSVRHRGRILLDRSL